MSANRCLVHVDTFNFTTFHNTFQDNFRRLALGLTWFIL